MEKILVWANWATISYFQTIVFTQRKSFCIWWDWKGILYYELLPNNQSINSNMCCLQLDELNMATQEKCPEVANRKGIVFHQDNTRSYVSLITRQKLLDGLLDKNWLGCATPPAIFSRYCTFRLLLIQTFAKYP